LHAKRVDFALQRVANAAQLGLLVLAIFGYFYTVLPIYQKSLLDEEIAKKTLQLNALEGQLARVNQVLSAKEGELASRAGELAATEARLLVLHTEVNATRKGLDRALVEVGKLRGRVHEQYAELRPRLMRDFKTLAIRECKLSDLQEGGFASCIQEKVLISPQLTPLSIADRNLLQSIVAQQNARVHQAWKDQDPERLIRELRQVNERCAQLKASSEYRDGKRAEEIDQKCGTDTSAIYGVVGELVSRALRGDDFLTKPLEAIAERFLTSER